MNMLKRVAKVQNKENSKRKTRGRPRSFDEQKALDRALRVFWRKGYEGASLSDLTSAMGIERPSLYATFGDKEALFRRVLDHYQNGPANYAREALQEPTSRGVAERLFRDSANCGGDPHTPGGCLLVQGALACGNEAKHVQEELASRRAAAEVALRRRFQRAKAQGDLPLDVDARVLARYVMAVLHGMAVRSAAGASRKELRGIGEMAMRVWPQDPRT
jgi:AcrR family transcriptional regulator